MTCHKGGSLAHKRYNCLFKSAGRQRLNSGPLPLLFLPVTFSCLAIQVKYINTQKHKYTQIQIHQHKYTIDCTTDLSHQYHHNSRYSEKLFISYLKLCYSGQPNFLPTSTSTWFLPQLTMYLVPPPTDQGGPSAFLFSPTLPGPCLLTIQMEAHAREKFRKYGRCSPTTLRLPSSGVD